jgi:hypothetical protein
MSLIVDCLADLTSKLEGVPQVRNKVFTIISEDDLLDKARLTKLPSAGVFYGGIVTQGKPGGGLGTVARFVIAVLFEAKTVGNQNTQSQALELLDAIRDEIKHKRSPAVYVWRFSSESAGDQVGNVMVYTQTWECPVIVT